MKDVLPEYHAHHMGVADHAEALQKYTAFCRPHYNMYTLLHWVAQQWVLVVLALIVGAYHHLHPNLEKHAIAS